MYRVLNHARGINLIEFYNNNNFHVILSNYGASIYQIDSPNNEGELETITLTPRSMYYFNNSKYMGLTIGRVAGRIKDSLYKINGFDYHIEPNENNNLLHSGADTFAYKKFDYIIDDSDDYTNITFYINVKDMEDGFPGDLDLKVVYKLFKSIDTIRVEYFALSNKDTFLNITNHSYFNLSGDLKNNIENHYLTINADKYVKTGQDLIPISLEDVTKELDFRTPKKIKTDLKSEQIMFTASGYDHMYHSDDEIRINLECKTSGRILNIKSNYHDCVIYTNNYLTDTVYINGVNDSKYLAIAIEPSRVSNILNKDGYIQKARELYN